MRNLPLVALATFISLLICDIAHAEISDHKIKQIIIEKSVANYSGNCPCPYNRDRAGRKCGKRSAYSRPGGAAPICYNYDITSDMIQNYRLRLERY